MAIHFWSRNLFLHQVARTIRKARRRARPAIEALEDRWCLSTFTVTNSANSGVGSLRWAVGKANAAPGATTIKFASSVTEIVLQGNLIGQGGLELGNTMAPITIQAPARGVIVEGNFVTGANDHVDNVFTIDSGVRASFSNLLIGGGFDEDPFTGGGGMLNDGTVTLTGCKFVANYAGDGGSGLDNQGSATLVNCSFNDNTAGNGSYGALYNGGTAKLTNCTFSDNTAEPNVFLGSGGGGGGLYNDGKVTLANCTFTDNTAQYGGGLYNDATAKLTNCTFSHDTATEYGGGVYNNATMNLTNCTFNRDLAGPNYYGGGLYNNDDAALVSCTFANCSATYGGGVSNEYYLSLINTIVARNTATGGGPDVYNDTSVSNGNYFVTLTSRGHNLIGETDDTSDWVGTDLVGTIAKPLDPNLGLLASNGGPTQTIALLPGSVAIGKGTRVQGITTDQRGFPLDNPPDIGAYQTQKGRHSSV